MPRHVDRTANVERTPEELLSIYYSLDHVDSVVDGYPQLDQRLRVPLAELLLSRPGIILGRQVRIFDIPAGYDATNSAYRRQTLATMSSDDFLHGPADPDLPTGGDWRLSETDPTVVRAIRDRCRDFTQHLQPLVPGWKELLALPVGMPTGIGWYTHYWLSDMCDAVTYRIAKSGDDLEVLLYPRPGDAQSEPVYATPGGYVIKVDTQTAGITPLQAASARRTAHWAKRDVSAYQGVPLRVKYPISSGNTLVAGLRTSPYARFIGRPDYEAEPTVRPVADHMQRAAGFVSLRALATYNPTGGTSGKGNGDNPFPIWTTHFEYVLAGMDAVSDPEQQHRLGISSQQFALIKEVVEDLQSNFPALQG